MNSTTNSTIFTTTETPASDATLNDTGARLVRVVSVTVFAVLAVSGLVGEQLLHLVGASLPAFRVGGGLVLLLMALAMLNAQAGGVRQSQAAGNEVSLFESSHVGHERADLLVA